MYILYGQYLALKSPFAPQNFDDLRRSINPGDPDPIHPIGKGVQHPT